MANWWGTKKDVSPRLIWEVEAMRATFGNTFELVVPPFGGLLYWQGTVNVNMSILENPEHTLKIVYPKEYPNRPAEAYCIKPRIYSEKHQYEDGQLCLFNPKDGEQYGWNPSKSTAVTVAGLGDTMALCLLHMACRQGIGPVSKSVFAPIHHYRVVAGGKNINGRLRQSSAS